MNLSRCSGNSFFDEKSARAMFGQSVAKQRSAKSAFRPGKSAFRSAKSAVAKHEPMSHSAIVPKNAREQKFSFSDAKKRLSSKKQIF